MATYGKSMWGGWYYESPDRKEYYLVETRRELKAVLRERFISLKTCKRVDHS